MVADKFETPFAYSFQLMDLWIYRFLDPNCSEPIIRLRSFAASSCERFLFFLFVCWESRLVGVFGQNGMVTVFEYGVKRLELRK
ncbi:unnamed protein product [Citrullus colocynthis]|uniref:Uncharacterized protein n=1 Tax=Citrullus colocynthis TaxID=252529 RepID=A0ABP0YQK0_9ROSI